MRVVPQFKHVNGRNGKVESICMNCLLAVGICCSDKELEAKEGMHNFSGKAEEVGHGAFEVEQRAKSMMVWTWNQLVDILPRRRPTTAYWPGTHDK